jgi:hypothetical protein
MSEDEFSYPGQVPAGLRGAPAYTTAHSCAWRAKDSGSESMVLATSASCGSEGLGFSSSTRSDMRIDLMVWTGVHPLPRESRQIVPCDDTSVGGSARVVVEISTATPHGPSLAGHPPTVTLLTLGCQILVSKLKEGGLNGYSFVAEIETTYVPPAYGVSGGPRNLPLICLMSSPSGQARTPEASASRAMSCSSRLRRLGRFADMVGFPAAWLGVK